MATAVEKHISSEIFKLKLTINFIKHIIHVFTVQRLGENIILPMAALRRAVKKHVEQVMMVVFKMITITMMVFVTMKKFVQLNICMLEGKSKGSKRP